MSEIVREDQNQFTGKRGETIVVGDFVAAAIREGNSATMKVGRVQRIYHQKGPYSWQNGYRVQILFNGASRVSTMENTYNITKIEDQWTPEPAPFGSDLIRLEVQIKGRRFGVQSFVVQGSSTEAYIHTINYSANQAAEAIQKEFE
jgi:hypothetical protein